MFHKNFLAKEILKWQNEGIIEQDRAKTIAQKYDIDLNNINSGSNFILRLIAYFFLGCSVMVLVGANWQEIPRELRSIGLIFLTGVLNFAGFYQLKNGNNKQANAILFLASLVFGACIALIAQIYHLNKSMANGFLFWSIGTLLVGVLSRKSIVAALGIFVSIAWVIALLYENINANYHILLVFMAVGIFVAYFESSTFLIRLLVACGAIYLLIFILLPNFYDIESNLKTLTFCAFAYFLLLISLKPLLERVGQGKNGAKLCQTAIFYCVVFMIFCIWTGSFLNYYDLIGRELYIIFKLEYILFFIFILMSMVINFIYKNKILLIVSFACLIFPFVQINFNLIMSIICVLAGAALIKNNMPTLGMSAIFNVAIVRYIDLIGDYIGTSILFLCFGVTILFVIKKRMVK